MAKASWCSVDPASGTGNKTGVKVTGTEYTGRTARNTTLTVKTTTGSPAQTKTISVNQVATEQIQVTFESASVSALTTTVSFSGTSNSPKLTFDISNATIATLNVNGSNYTNGAAISGDPGASGFYEFSGTATLTRNETAADKIITLTVGGSSSSVTMSATMKQLKGTFEYKIVPVATKTSFAATGGTATVSCTYDTYLDGTKIYTGTELTGFNLASNATTVATVSGVTITVVNNKSTSAKSATITVSKSGYTSATIALSQSAGAKVYNTPVISTYTYDKRDAAGGTLTPNLAYSQVWTWNGVANSGATISGSTSSPATGVTIAATIPTAVTGASVAASTGVVTWAANQGAERSVTVSLTITMNGKTSAAKTATATQLADAIDHYGNMVINAFTVNKIPAAGGTISQAASLAYVQKVYYVSGKITDITSGATVTYGNAVTATSLGTVVTNETSKGSLSVTVALNGKSATKTATVYQVANRVTKIASDATFSYAKISPSATTAPVTNAGFCVCTFTSGSTLKCENTTSAPANTTMTAKRTYTLTEVKNGFTEVYESSGTLTATNMGKTLGSRTSGTVSCDLVWTLTHAAEYGGAVVTSDNGTKTATCTQGDNVITYGVPTITKGAYASFAASENTKTPSATTYSQVGTYTSGSTDTYTDGGAIKYSMPNTTGFTLNSASTGSLTAAARGTTIGNPRSATITVKVTINGKSNTATITATQAGNYVTAVTPAAITLSYPDIAAGATSSTPTIGGGAVTYTFSSGSTSTTAPSATYGALTSANDYKLSASQNGFTAVNKTSGVLTATSRGTTEGDARTSGTVTRTYTVTWTPTASYNSAGTKTGSKTATDTCTQALNKIVKVTIAGTASAGSVGAIPAKGGTVTWTPTATYSSGLTSTSTSLFTPNYKVSGTGATQSSNITTWSNRTTTVGDARSVTVTVSVTSSYTTTAITGTATTTQAANAITAYGDITIASLSYPNVAAAGSTSTPSVGAVTQAVTYSSESPGSISVTPRKYSIPTTTGASINSSTGVVTWAANNSTSSRSVTVTLTVTANSKTATKTATCTQNAGAKTYATPVVSAYSYATFAAAGATKTPTVSYSQTWGWNGATSGGGTITDSGGTLKFKASSNVTGCTLNSTSTGSISWASRGTTVGDARSAHSVLTVTVTMNGKTSAAKQCTACTQEANTITKYGGVTAGTITAADIPASGGTSTATLGAGSQTITYTSGSTRPGTITTSQTAAVSASNLTTTVKDRTKVGSITGTWSGEGSKSATKAVDVYQAENKVTNSNYQPTISAYGTPTISIGSGITAAGGHATVTASVLNTESYKKLYTSGSTSSHTRSKDGTVTLKEQADNNGRFSLSGTTLSHSNMTTNLTTDTCTIRATNSGDSTKYKDDSISVQNIRSVESTSGGVTTYGNVTAGTITNKTIPASGGEATATAGNGSQTWSKTAVVTTYVYTSGSTKDETTTDATSGTNTISPSVASITASAASKDKTESSTTTVKSQAVTWSGSGSKSASGTMYIYQAANTLTWGSWTLTCTANKYSTTSSPCPASGGTATISSSCTRSGSYTSGSTTSDSSTVTLSMATATGATWNSTNKTVTWASRGTSASSSQRSVVVTATAEGLSKSVTIYQAKNEIKSYTYGDYTGTLSLNSSSAMSAGSDSRTVTFGYIRRSKTPVYDSGSSGTATTETWSGTAYLTIAVNSGSSYCTLSKSNYTNSSSTTTSTLTKSTYGTTVISAQTYTISLRQSSASGTVIASVTIKTTANAKTTITYGMPAITKTTPVTIAAAGSTVSIYAGATYSQTRKQNYTSLSQETLSNLTGNVADLSGKSCSVVTAKTGFTLTTSSGSLAVTNNTSTSARNGFVGRISLTLNGQPATKDITYNQSAGAKQYGTPTITFTIAATTIAADGGTINVTAASVSRPYTWNGVSGSGGTDTAVPTLAINPAVTGCSITTSAVTISSHEGESERTIKCVASYSGATNVTRTITQAAAELGIGKMVIGSTFKVF